MSAFMVSDATITACVDAIAWHKRGAPFHGYATHGGRTSIGRALCRMNGRALGQRYGIDCATQMTRANAYRYPADTAIEPTYRMLKALECFLYQCNEGTVPKSRLFRDVEAVSGAVARHLCRETAEYRKQEWDLSDAP